MLRTTNKARGTVYSCGNGGSASTASHFVNDLMKMTGGNAVCLADNTALLTALANDASYASVFSAQLLYAARANDLLVVFSGSGDSPNILNAVKEAHELRMPVIALSGGTGGQLRNLAATQTLVVDSANMQIIEDVHLAISHMLCQAAGKPSSSTS